MIRLNDVHVWRASAPHGEGRRIAREILKTYAGRADITLVQGPNGKPMLDKTGGIPDLRFNLSHSGEMILMAIALAREVGIDVERIQARCPWQEIAQRFFAECDRASLRQVAADVRRDAFFALWARKEALAKARGLTVFDGLAQPGLHGARDVYRVKTDDDATWGCRSLPAPIGYAAALAIEGSMDCTVEHHEF